MALARTAAITVGLLVVTMTSSCRSPTARQRLTLAGTFRDDAWRLVAARDGSPVEFAGAALESNDGTTALEYCRVTALTP